MINKLLFNISSFFVFLIVTVTIIFVTLYKENIVLPLWQVLVFFILIIFFLYFIYIYSVWSSVSSILNWINSLVKWEKFFEIDIKSDNEFWVIANFINQMVVKLNGLSWELQQWNNAIVHTEAVFEIKKGFLPLSGFNSLNWLDVMIKSKSSAQVWRDVFNIMWNKENTYLYLWSVNWQLSEQSLVAIIFNSTIKALLSSSMYSVDILNKANNLLSDEIKSNHTVPLTLFRWSNETNQMFYTWAWYNMFLLFSWKTWQVSPIKTWGVAIKMMQDSDNLFVEQEIPFSKWDVIFAFWDWVIEAKNKLWDKYGVIKLTSLLENNWLDDVKNISSAFEKDFSDFVWWQVQEDDISIIIIKNTWEWNDNQNVEIWFTKDSWFNNWSWNFE